MKDHLGPNAVAVEGRRATEVYRREKPVDRETVSH